MRGNGINRDPVDIGWTQAGPNCWISGDIKLIVHEGVFHHITLWTTAAGTLGYRDVDLSYPLESWSAKVAVAISGKFHVLVDGKMIGLEFDAWMKAARNPEEEWVLDSVLWHNAKEMLFWRGRQAGIYVIMTPTGQVEMGFYEAKSEHITDAIFKTSFRKQLTGSARQSYEQVATRLNIPALVSVKVV